MSRTEEQYNELLQRLGAAIDRRDPLGLLAFGSPADEYEGEVGALATRIEDCHTIESSLDIVSSVFSKTLGATAGRRETYRPLANDVVDIALWWSRQG